MLAGVLREGWHPVTALYVVAQIATTVGYGDVTVSCDAMKLFMTLYIFVLLVVVSFLRQSFAQRVVDDNALKLGTFFRGLRRQFPSAGNRASEMLFGTSCQFALAVAFGTLFHASVEGCLCPKDGGPTGCVDASEELCLRTGGVVTSWISALYMSMVTMTTVGFGDHVPRTLLGQAFGIIWMVYGSIASASFFSVLAEFLLDVVNARRRPGRKWEDAGGGPAWRGEHSPTSSVPVSRDEFRVRALLRLGVLSEEVLAKIDRDFDAVVEGSIVQWHTAPLQI